MPQNISKNFAISPSILSQIVVKYKIYGLFWTIKLTILHIYRKLFFEFFRHSYSQYGEDLQIAKLLAKDKIFYVDVGANEPHKFNNTFHFYLRGSRGINIEPDPVLLSKYSKSRQRDINLNYGLASKPGWLTYYKMYPGVNSTFSRQHYLRNLKNQSILLSSSKIKVGTLTQIFRKYLPSNTTIDLLSIDTEGYDYQVLLGNDWQKYQPTVICIETQSHQLAHKFLIKLGYKLTHHTKINSIYLKDSPPVFPIASTI